MFRESRRHVGRFTSTALLQRHGLPRLSRLVSPAFPLSETSKSNGKGVRNRLPGAQLSPLASLRLSCPGRFHGSTAPPGRLVTPSGPGLPLWDNPTSGFFHPMFSTTILRKHRPRRDGYSVRRPLFRHPSVTPEVQTELDLTIVDSAFVLTESGLHRLVFASSLSSPARLLAFY